jgi:hypothetical protein
LGSCLCCDFYDCLEAHSWREKLTLFDGPIKQILITGLQ